MLFIFDRFWHGESARGSSSGLRLAIARQLIRDCGGSISVESRLEEGSTFTIELPQ